MQGINEISNNIEVTKKKSEISLHPLLFLVIIIAVSFASLFTYLQFFSSNDKIAVEKSESPETSMGTPKPTSSITPIMVPVPEQNYSDEDAIDIVTEFRDKFSKYIMVETEHMAWPTVGRSVDPSYLIASHKITLDNVNETQWASLVKYFSAKENGFTKVGDNSGATFVIETYSKDNLICKLYYNAHFFYEVKEGETIEESMNGKKTGYYDVKITCGIFTGTENDINSIR